MFAPADRIIVQLAAEIADIQPGKARRAGAITAPIQAMAGEAGIGGAAVAAAQRDDLARAAERVGLDPLRLACAKAESRRRQPEEMRFAHAAWNLLARALVPVVELSLRRVGRGLLRFALVLVLLAAACKPLPDERHEMPGTDPVAGLEAMKKVGCGSCHAIPGIAWPEGRVGPSLDGFADQALIAGRAQNRPEILAAFVRNAPAIVPGTSMPPMPLTPEESRDVAAYLYTLERR